VGTQFCAKSALVVNKGSGWKRVIDEMFGSVDLKISDEVTFSGEIRHAKLGAMELTEVVSDYEDSQRTKRHVAQDKKEFFVLVLVKHGKLQIEQFNRECVLGPGSFALFDLNSPYRYRHSERSSVLDIKISTSMLCGRIADPYRFVAKTRSAQTGTGRVTADFISSLAAEVSRIPQDIAQSYACRTADLMGILFQSEDDDLPIGNSTVRSALYRRCTSYIECNSTDPNLDPEAIAAAMRISVRYLHRIFQDAGQSVGEYLRSYRLQRCHGDLATYQTKSVSIKEIALRAGFQSQSHFSSAFKHRYRTSPSEVRQLAIRERAGPKPA